MRSNQPVFDVDFSGYNRVLEFVVDLPSRRWFEYSIVFTLHTGIQIFTVAHGWVSFFVESKLIAKAKVAGIAYLHPVHRGELNGFVGMCKSFDHLVKNQVGVDDARKHIRRDIWCDFHKLLIEMGIEK